MTPGREAEIGHVVGLVDDGDAHRVQADGLLAHQVFEPAGAGDDDVDAGAQRATCRDCATPPKIVVTVRPAACASGCTVAVIWVPARGWAPAPDRWAGSVWRRTPCSRATSGGERQRLAAAGLAAAEHVTAGRGIGQGLGLDGERTGDAALGQTVTRAAGTPRSAKPGRVVFTFRTAAFELVGENCRWATSIAARKSWEDDPRRVGSALREPI